MPCLTCRNLELALESQRSRYLEATAQASNKISTRLAAYHYVEMQRARNDLEEHGSICVFASNAGSSAHAFVLNGTTATAA